ncbi:MAG: murein biosynthesis integral membrane protein MurJ [Candidatus Omnitrophica bacterium]|nr:murein biosynthesis integral membrane protein MurJ [Candidatus Omnitrophota bacterium]
MTLSTSHRIARSTGALSLATGISRVLGFVRDLLMARLFGTLAEAQAFVVAFRLPNMLRDLVAEGAVTSAAVPVLSAYKATKPPEEFWRLSQTMASRLFVFLAALSLLGVAAAEPLVRLIAPGFAAEPQKLALTVLLTRVLFPLIFLVGFWAYFMGVLNSLHHFVMPALGPAILNLAMIAACLWAVPQASSGALALAVGVMIGGLLQVLVQLPAAARLGFRWRWQWRHPGSKEILRLLGPRTFGAAVYQVSVVVHTALASLGGIVGEGAVASLYYANRLVQLPLALFGTATAQASLPSLSEQAARQDTEAFERTLRSVIRMVGFIMMPATVGLLVLARPIIQGLFERGAFTREATLMTTQILIGYAAGLWAYAMSKVLTGAFYALRETRVPVRLAAEAVAVNVGLSLVLMWPLRASGLAWAAALSNTLNALRLFQSLERRLGTALLRPALAPLGRSLAASACMGLGCWALWQGGGFAARPWLGLVVVIPAGVGLYAVACHVLRVEEFSTARRWLNKLQSAPPLGNE